MPIRCAWVPIDDPLYVQYHDLEWGTPVHDDQTLFEFLVLEGFQAGLSWRTILHKRMHFREAFDEFNPEKIAEYDDAKISLLMSNPNIIRNRSKINACVSNARIFLNIQREFDSFDKFIWEFVGGKPLHNNWKSISEIPGKTAESELMSKELALRGFRFVGPTICYAHMQATGMVNDHTIDCYRYDELNELDNSTYPMNR